MLQQNQLLTLLGQLYDAAIDPRAWRSFLELLAHAYSATAGVFTQDLQRATGQPCGSAANAALARSALHSSFAEGIERLPLARHEADPSGSEQFFHRLESVLFEDDAVIMSLALTRARDKGAFSQQEICDWEWLSPHLRRVVKVCTQSARSDIGMQAALFALDALGVGIAVVSCEGVLLFANRVAEQMLDRADGIAVIQGRLRVAPVVSEHFARHLSRIATDTWAQDSSGEVIALPRDLGERPISARVLPLAGSQFTLVGPSAVILLNDPMRDLQLRQRDLASVYRLTAAEGKLLRELVRGVPLANYAAAAGIARSTAKTYLHQIFAKTGQSRQSDLVREILSDPLLRVGGEAVNVAAGRY